MRPIYLVILLIGLTHAAQQRSPVYMPNPAPVKSLAPPIESSKNAQALPVTGSTAQPVGTQQPIAQAREGQGDNSGTAASPSQSYMVYYYPEYRAQPYNPQAPAQQSYLGESNGIFKWSGWRDVGYIVPTVLLLGLGGGLLYNVFGTQVKARALRELKELKPEDAARMARSVLRAIERFREMNTQ